MDGLEQRIEKAVRGQAQPTVTVLSSLLAVEDELHYIPREAVDWVARFMGATVNDVWAVASFYPNFRFEPPAQRQVEVCWGASCHLMGAMKVVDAVLEAAGLESVAKNPSKPFYGRETMGDVEYFTAVYADVAVSPSCVTCHNAHEDSPRNDFKAGEVMGGVIIRIPLR